MKLKKREKLQILCDGGLGNRLNGLIGGILTAKELNLDTHISWPLNNWCRACFTDLFDFSFKTFDNNNIHQVFEANKDNYFAIHSNQINYPIPQNKQIHSDNYQLPKSAVFYHCLVPPRFSYDQIINVLKSFKIKDSILNKTKQFLTENKIDHNTIGVHLRRTDFQSNESDSNILSWIKDYPNHQFFLCSDDKETELLYAQQHNVHTHPKESYVSKLVEGNWNKSHKDEQGRAATCNMDRSKQAVIDGFVDMLILAHTNIQVGQERSTYFKYAKMYNQIKYKNHELD